MKRPLLLLLPHAALLFGIPAVLLTGFAAVARPAAAPFKSTDFTDSAFCGGCHVEIYAQWQGSMHNNALTDPFYLGVYAQASRETGGAFDANCVSCHTPFGGDSGEAPPPTGPQISAITKQGIQCDFCHTLTGPDAYGPSQTKYGPYTDSVSSFHGSAYFGLLTKSDFCGLCHDQLNPENQLPVQSTFTEWKSSGYAAQGIQCQDCHMTPGPGVTEPNPGKAAKDGPDRPNIYTHFFTGGNATSLASPEHQALARENLEAAATVRMDPAGAGEAGAISGGGAAGTGAAAAAGNGNEPKPAPGSIQLNVKVNNKGAGHFLPTGVTEIREMWLEIEVTDWAGNVLFHSGGVDQNGAIDPGAIRYGTIYRAGNGQPTLKAWQAAAVLSDHRVPPQGSLSDTMQVPLPDDVPRPLLAFVTVHYRSVSQAQADESMGKGTLTPPVIDMTGDCLFI